MSWEQLLSIRDEWIEEISNVDRTPAACPNDGEPLVSGPNGQLECPWDGWRPN